MEGLQESELAGLHISGRHGQGGSGAPRQAALGQLCLRCSGQVLVGNWQE